MKRLLVAAGEKDLNTVTIDFACYLARLTQSDLTGVFPAGDTRTDATDRHAQQFLDACVTRDVIGAVRQVNSLDEIVSLSKCADLVIIDPDFTMHAQALEAYPSHWAKKLLHESGCPVVIAPLSFEGIDEIVLAYDGSKSSLHAIRLFKYLFPELNDTKTTLLQIWLEEDEHPGAQAEIYEWLKMHFGHLESVILEAASNDGLTQYMLTHPRAFVVMGGFGRSRLSRLIQPSASGDVVRLLSSPLFIAHQ